MSEQLKKNYALWIIIGLVAIIVLAGFWNSSWKRRHRPVIDVNKYQAVFLEGNQQYFGHLKNLGTRYPYLADVYYVQVVPGAVADPTQQNFSLVKLGGEIHGPEDMIYLNWDKVLFWENVRDDSKVVQGILQEKTQRAGQPSQSTGN